MTDTDHLKTYCLRTSIQCHSSDIRCVSALPNGGFVTGSRDKTCKAYLPIDNINGFNEVQNLLGPENYISSICCLNTNNETFIFVGSNDSNIYCYSLENSEPIYKLQDHSGTVCALSVNNERALVVSGSWDQTCRVWKEKKCEAVLVGHEAAVWSTAVIGEHVLTGSADKTIKLWKLVPNVECIITMSGHTDCIRGLSVISDTEFISCSNDASIRLWNIKGEIVREFYGHENYIYSIANITGGHEFASCSEDRTVRIWNNNDSKDKQTIPLPATTLWSITRLSNNDLAIGSSTGKIYIFTRDDKLKAKPEELKLLEEELAKSTLHVSDIGDIKVSELPTADTLLMPGTKDGQTKLVKDGDKVTVHNWDATKQQWIKIGDVVGAADTNKELYEGVEYDYVFSIDIEEGKPRLKLPYNKNQNPYAVAQDFIDKHNLSQLFLDEIANFIIKNTSTPATISGQNCDPLTGGSSYSTQQNGSVVQPMDISVNNDFPAKGLFPQEKHILFESINVEGIAKKLKEFSDLLSPELRLESDDIQILLRLSDLSFEVEPKQLRLIRHLLSWPKLYIFPALDLIRASLLLPQINEDLCASKDSMRLIDTLLVCGTDANSTPNQLVAYRAICNLFAHPVGQHLALANGSIIFKALSKPLSTNKNAMTALSTIFLNFAITFNKTNEQNSEQKFQCFTTVINHLNEIIEPEAVYRLLVSLGTLAFNDSNINNLFKNEELLDLLKKIKSNIKEEKVVKCVDLLLEM
ncbi:phospholipase A-2-activating protein-like [Oppia nitens]|uniref:phospholipase A-2-activating protein-like n=1 Tax=Oppia nitens TaxID=1686743 RepID=UPI0023DB448E|nr:phospholipase A-2-activating protein-like [Oppia nitens]